MRGFVEQCLRGVGQVVFCNSSVSGAMILSGLTLGDPYLGGMAALGTISATAAAKVLAAVLLNNPELAD